MIPVLEEQHSLALSLALSELSLIHLFANGVYAVAFAFGIDE